EKPNGARAEEIKQFDLSVINGRLSFLLALLNLSTLFRPVVKRRCVVSLASSNLKGNLVTFRPIGLVKQPSNVKQLVTALRNILMALAALPEIGLIHRDLRWESVLKYQDRDEWFLIDFDEGDSSPAQGAHHLNPESHAPEIASEHSVLVDIWGCRISLTNRISTESSTPAR
ncbi:hypothetical protein JG687_00010592, partial [Phytophthora cactorum]